MSRVTLRVGDSVTVCDRKKVATPTPARIVAITAEPGKSVGVEFANPVSNHDCDGAGKANHCLWVTPEAILLPKEAEDWKKLAAAAKPSLKPRQDLVLEVEGSRKTVHAL